MDMGIFAWAYWREWLTAYLTRPPSKSSDEGRVHDKWVKRALNVCSVNKVHNVSLALWSVSAFAAMSQCN